MYLHIKFEFDPGEMTFDRVTPWTKKVQRDVKFNMAFEILAVYRDIFGVTTVWFYFWKLSITY